MIWKRYPTVRTVLLIVNLVVLILPLGSLVFFRIYENKLVQETETELISQAALIGALLKERISREVPAPEQYGTLVTVPKPVQSSRYYTPQAPEVNLAKNEVLPSRPDGIAPEDPPDPVLLRIGGEITKVFVDAQKTTLAGMRLLDYRGVTIGGRSDVGLSFAHVAEVQTSLSGRYASVIRERFSEATPPFASISRNTGIRIFIAYPVLHDEKLWGVVYLSRTPNNILKDMYAERDQLILAGITILALTLALGLFTSWTISRPINEMIQRARRTAAGDAQTLQPLERPGTRELALLSRSFSDMANSLQERSAYIRDFASRISHEFKTPLTAIQGSAELLGEHRDTMSEEERERFLGNILADTDRLKRLTNRLLELARADNLVPTDTRIDIWPVLEGIKAQHGCAAHDITLSGERDLSAAISADNLETVLANLVVNAFQNSASEVSIDLYSDADQVALMVSDNGTGISKLNSDKIFDPFFTTRREEGGTGLGLRIVRAILEAHGGSISLAATEPRTSFVLSLPAS